MNKLKSIIFIVKFNHKNIYLSFTHLHTKSRVRKLRSSRKEMFVTSDISGAEARVNEREQLFVLSRNAHYYKRNSRLICISS